MTSAAAAAYGRRADEYIDAVGRIEHAEDADVTLIVDWARGVHGPVLDVGCGPGQWTHLLATNGVDVEGIDPVPAFLDRARQSYPGVPFRLGCAEELDAPTSSLGGILAWYSLIHSSPGGVAAALGEFAICVRPGGGLLLGFFTAEVHGTFDHAVTTAHHWPLGALEKLVVDAGFSVTHSATRPGRPGRTHGEIVAVRDTAPTSP
ncbi:class I SAM-dependent methyltransferase [Corynebacteriaceae bacterium 7-707]